MKVRPLSLQFWSRRRSARCRALFLNLRFGIELSLRSLYEMSKPKFKRSVFVALLNEESVLTVVENDGKVGLPGGKSKAMSPG